MEQRPMVILTGPTAVGKSALSVALAKRIDAEIISADSMQVYRHMDIGSAKITEEEMGGVPHYLIDELEPCEEFHVARFKELAKRCAETVWAKGKVPLIVGGTGFYIQALLYDIDFTEQDSDAEYRRRLKRLADERGAEYLHELLRKADPKSAAAIHANNRKRVIRALEYHHLTGEQISEHNERERARPSPYNFAYFVLSDDREKLYARIEARVDAMIEAGLVDEVRRLQEMGCRETMVSMQGLGYKEILAYLNGRCTLEEAVSCIKRETRHFAKRQFTWFRREREVIWLEKAQYGYREEAILDEIVSVLQEKHIWNGDASGTEGKGQTNG